MQWRRPHHTRWLVACLVGLLLASVISGFNLGLAVMVVVIFAVGAAVLCLDGLGAPEPVSAPEPEPEPEPAPEAEPEVTPSGDQPLA